VGDLAGLDGLPGAATLAGGGRGEGSVAGDAAGHHDGGDPGGEFLPDQARGSRAQHRSGRRPRTVTVTAVIVRDRGVVDAGQTDDREGSCDEG
jgi:hypothetical protein